MNKTKLPDFIIHYSRGEPFRTLTRSPQNEWQNIIETLNPKNAWGLDRFSDLNYLKQRIQVEDQLLNAFIAKGGEPILKQPIYFFLGPNKRFEEVQLNKGYKINLKNISTAHISFTCGDSMLALVEENRNQSGTHYQNSFCKQVYRLEELSKIYTKYQSLHESQVVFEAQLWIMPSHDIIETIA